MLRWTLPASFLLLAAACASAAPGDVGTSSEEAFSSDLTIWPNTTSFANSDPWLADHHDSIREMRPHVLVLNFANHRSVQEVTARVHEIFAGLDEGSRYHGYSDPIAPAFLAYKLAKVVDLTDGSPRANSALTPRKANAQDAWQFGYGALFGKELSDRYGFDDPSNPGRSLSVCELLARGKVHEIWVNTDPGGPVSAESLEYKQVYDAAGNAVPGRFDRCAGNGCIDADDLAPIAACGRSIRIVSIGESRGPGCALHSLGHSFEGTGRDGGPVPPLTKDFLPFANFDLHSRLGLPFDNWYACAYGFDTNAVSETTCPLPLSTVDERGNQVCISFSGRNSLSWNVGGATGEVASYDQGCGSVHFPPNARDHYDAKNRCPARSTCEHFGLHDGKNGVDAHEPYDASKAALYDHYAGYPFADCEGGWQIYWRQSFPGYANPATGRDGAPIRNWWPYLFY